LCPEHYLESVLDSNDNIAKLYYTHQHQQTHTHEHVQQSDQELKSQNITGTQQQQNLTKSEQKPNLTSTYSLYQRITAAATQRAQAVMNKPNKPTQSQLRQDARLRARIQPLNVRAGAAREWHGGAASDKTQQPQPFVSKNTNKTNKRKHKRRKLMHMHGTDDGNSNQEQESMLADPLQGGYIDARAQFQAIGGLAYQIKCLKECVLLPLLYPEIFVKLHIDPPRGVLLYGPPGTGKTLLVCAYVCVCVCVYRYYYYYYCYNCSV